MLCYVFLFYPYPAHPIIVFFMIVVKVVGRFIGEILGVM
ncbi:hypothetical protein LD85_0988 [Saccharolobus islandicus L.D.8.5]|uniref:Uncharacterized protein n=1 Tax=Saccharolobus islandicus (strain L.D.8.5 / Lassen \|nr:hypothetical protein LD85_0988 [Sulfolobus islandicus L.D.8.5]